MSKVNNCSKDYIKHKYLILGVFLVFAFLHSHFSCSSSHQYNNIFMSRCQCINDPWQATLMDSLTIHICIKWGTNQPSHQSKNVKLIDQCYLPIMPWWYNSWIRKAILISIIQLYNAGFAVGVEHICCVVIFHMDIIMNDIKYPLTGSWLVAFSVYNNIHGITPKTFTSNTNAIHQIISHKHWCSFCTCACAINNDQLLCISGVTTDAVHQNLPSPSTVIQALYLIKSHHT